MSNGHFGLPSIRLLIAAIAALLVHFIVPFGLVQFGGPAAPESDWVTRGDVVAHAEDFAGLTSLNASPALALAGLVIAIAGAGLLVFLGFQPLSVIAARWIGASASCVAAIGLAITAMASLYSVGTGLATFLGSLGSSEFVASFWAVSPVGLVALAGYGIWQARSVALRVVAARDGLREEARKAINLGLAGLVLMAGVLVLPWSIAMIPDGVSDALGAQLPFDEPTPLWLSAEDIQSVTPAEAHPEGRARFAAGFDGLSAAIHVQLALAWTAFAAGWLRLLAATASSNGAPLLIAVRARLVMLPLGLLLAAAIVAYVLAWILVGDGTDTRFLPGFFPVLLLAPFYWMTKQILGGVQQAMGRPIAASP